MTPEISRRTLFTGFAAATALALAGCATDSAGDASGSGSAGAASAADAAAAGERVSLGAVTPAVGALAGSTAVTLSGAGFDGDSAVASVSFGSEPAASFTVVDDSTITLTTPASFNFAVGAVPVTVVLADGTQVVADAAYAYEVQTPVDAQMQYAFTYWQDYNLAEWGQFPDNDCGNFVNQTMLQRGWEQNADWYSDYVATGDYSYSWIRGNQMDAYYASRPDTTRYEFSDRSQLKIGDVVMFDWDPQNDNGVDHTMMISKVTTNADGSISIAMVGHTLDATYRDLDNAVTVEKPGGTAHFWSIA
ncbi:amidase domain-containing protein [Herbiconiux moechotypicola]|uniref:IPT/TIG domain-containing protein n=1 Tax=Herbiconiux moechotypicola TaxID=637393 RepID=A0ABN3DCV2_9MICO|nr:amidase domain-containing protein [Herbiconiux moechotypicola]MCS5728721.1 amidase domain-containing protein [Herbiconiux moechotypicola]